MQVGFVVSYVCELDNLCVIPTYRHNEIGEKLLKDAFKNAKELNCNKIHIGIVEEKSIATNKKCHSHTAQSP